jgi:hypothetical protein
VSDNLGRGHGTVKALSKLSEIAVITLDTIVRAASDQVSCDLDGEAAILNLKSGTYFGLDPVGAFVWNQLATPQPVSRIATAMLEHYDVEPERCHSDLLVLLGQLNQRGLLELQPSVIPPNNDEQSG